MSPLSPAPFPQYRPRGRAAVTSIALAMMSILSPSCGSAASVPTEPILEPLKSASSGSVSVPTDDLFGALVSNLAQPTGRVERHTSLRAAGIDVSIVSIIVWDHEGGARTSRLETSGPLADHPQVAAAVAANAEMVRADDQDLDPAGVGVEHRLISAAVADVLAMAPLAHAGNHRLIGSAIHGDTVVRVMVELGDGRLRSVTSEFGAGGVGGSDQWRFQQG